MKTYSLDIENLSVDMVDNKHHQPHKAHKIFHRQLSPSEYTQKNVVG